MAILMPHPQLEVGPSAILRLKLHDGPNWSTAGPVLHAFDYSLNGNHGTLKGTAAYKHPGVDLDGDSDYIEIASHDDFSPVLTPFTVSFWAYVHEATNNVFINKIATGNFHEWQIQTGADDKLLWRLTEADASPQIQRKYDGAAIAENTWLHIVGTYNGGTLATDLAIYLNGVRVDDKTHLGAEFTGVTATGTSVRIGKSETNFGDGLMDDVMIFTKELTAQEIKNMYEVTRWRYGV